MTNAAHGSKQSWRGVFLCGVLLTGCTATRLRAELIPASSAFRAGEVAVAKVCNRGPGAGELDPSGIGLEEWLAPGRWRQRTTTSSLDSSTLPPRSCAQVRMSLPPALPLGLYRLRARVRRQDGGVSAASTELSIYGERTRDGVPVSEWASLRAEAQSPELELDRRCPGFAGFGVENGRFFIAMTADADEACIRRELPSLLPNEAPVVKEHWPVQRTPYRFSDLMRWSNLVAEAQGWSSAEISNGYIVIGVCDERGRRRVGEWLEVIPVPRDAVKVTDGCITLVSSNTMPAAR